MSKLLNVSSSPHVRDRVLTQNIMLDVAIAMIPASAYGVYQFGVKAALVLLVSVLSCVLSEFVFETAMRRPNTVSDGSALVTGMILGLNMPPAIPLWIPILGGIFAIIVVKLLYGGLGQNFMNPALAARCFLLISFAGKMTDFTYIDGISGSTPLAALKTGEVVDITSMFIGEIPGTIGEVSVIALLLGAAYLLVRKVITLRIPAAYLITFSVFVFIFGRQHDLMYVLAHLCGGGLIFGAFFMATDYVTSPVTPKGQICFGVLLGVLTGLFRIFGDSPEGVSYAIIIGNILVPLIEKISLPKAFGKGGIKMKKGGFMKDALILFVITLVSGLLLGGVYQITKEPIEKAGLLANMEAYKNVFPEAADFKSDDNLKTALDTFNAELHSLKDRKSVV